MLAASKAGPNRTGVKAARLLHYARRLERTLLTYERVGWTDTPAQTRTGTEVRPAAVSGPIILCLDTSGSMMGAREVVAKALALECMRQARTQKRACYLYSFSGAPAAAPRHPATAPRRERGANHVAAAATAASR